MSDQPTRAMRVMLGSEDSPAADALVSVLLVPAVLAPVARTTPSDR